MNEKLQSSAADDNAIPAGLDRRDFIKRAGTVAGGIMIATSRKSLADDSETDSEPSEAATTSPNDKINVALIGHGGRGGALVRQALSLKNYCQVVAVCDVFEKRALSAQEKVAKAGGEAKKFNNWEDVINLPEVDAVMIATPDHWHAPIALAAMRKGKDVYCEKPMTHTIAEAREMAEVSEKLGRIVQVGSQTTSGDQWKQAKKAIDDGMIGKLLMSQGSYHRNSLGGEWNYGIDADAGPDKTGENHIDWEMWQKPAARQYEWYPPRFFRFRKYWDYSGGIATDLFFHVMAPLNLCWPQPEFPWRVFGSGGIYAFDDGREVPDTFMLAADYPSGHSVILSSSMANSKHIPGVIRGHEGSIVMVEHGKFEAPTAFITVSPEDIGDTKQKFIAAYGSDQLQIPVKTLGDPLRPHFVNWFECIRSRQEPALSARKAYRVQVAITLSVDSYRQGQVLYFDTEKEMPTDRRPANTMNLARPGVLKGENVEEPGYGKAKLFGA